MNKDLNTELGRELKWELERLGAIESGSDEAKAIVGNLEKLYPLYIEENRSRASQKLESDKAKADTILRTAKLGIDILGITLPLGFYAVWWDQALEFEKTGTFTSQVFKNLMHFFKPATRS